VRGAYVTAAARDAIAKPVCALAATDDVALHGEVAHFASEGIGLDYQLHCPQAARRIMVFGRQAGAHIAALPAEAAIALGLRGGDLMRGARVLRTVRPLFPEQMRPLESRWYHFPELHDPRQSRRIDLQFDTAPGEIVAVYRHKPFDSAWSLSVARDGEKLAADFDTYYSWLFRSAGSHRWRVQIDTNAPQWAEVIVIAPVS